MQTVPPSQDYLINTCSSPRVATISGLEGPRNLPLQWLEISVAGAAKLLHDLNPRKVGPDEMPCIFRKELADKLADILAEIYRHSLTTGKLPQVR